MLLRRPHHQGQTPKATKDHSNVFFCSFDPQAEIRLPIWKECRGRIEVWMNIFKCSNPMARIGLFWCFKKKYIENNNGISSEVLPSFRTETVEERDVTFIQIQGSYVKFFFPLNTQIPFQSLKLNFKWSSKPFISRTSLWNTLYCCIKIC